MSKVIHFTLSIDEIWKSAQTYIQEYIIQDQKNSDPKTYFGEEAISHLSFDHKKLNKFLALNEIGYIDWNYKNEKVSYVSYEDFIHPDFEFYILENERAKSHYMLEFGLYFPNVLNIECFCKPGKFTDAT